MTEKGQGEAYIKVHTDFINMLHKLKSSTLHTYIALALRIGSDSLCWPSISKIASDSGISMNQAQRNVARLVKLGLVEVSEIGGKGRKSTNTYYLPYYVLFGGKDQAPSLPTLNDEMEQFKGSMDGVLKDSKGITHGVLKESKGSMDGGGRVAPMVGQAHDGASVVRVAPMVDKQNINKKNRTKASKEHDISLEGEGHEDKEQVNTSKGQSLANQAWGQVLIHLLNIGTITSDQYDTWWENTKGNWGYDSKFVIAVKGIQLEMEIQQYTQPIIGSLNGITKMAFDRLEFEPFFKVKG
jgi:predicted transcriptional regulator